MEMLQQQDNSSTTPSPTMVSTAASLLYTTTSQAPSITSGDGSNWTERFVTMFCGPTERQPLVVWDAHLPQFSDCFLNTLPIWIPAGFLLLFLPLEYFLLSRSKNPPINKTWLTCLRETACWLRAALNFVLLIVNIVNQINGTPSIHTNLFITKLFGNLVEICMNMLVLGLLMMDRKRGRYANGPVWCFWLLELVFHLPLISSVHENIVHGWDPLVIIDIVDILLSLFLFILSCFSDPHPQTDSPDPMAFDKSYLNYKKLNSPEEWASFLSQMTYAWVEPLCRLSRKVVMKESDIWECREDDKSDHVSERFLQKWRKAYNEKKEKTPLISLLLLTFFPEIIPTVLCTLLSTIAQFINPQLLKIIVAFVEDPSAPLWQGIFYAFCMLAAALIQSVAYNWYFWYVFVRVGFRIRTALISAVYRKSLCVNSHGTSSGEVVNLMAIDAQRIVDTIHLFDVAITGPLSIAIAGYFLYQELGVASIIGILLIILMTPFNALLIVLTKKLQLRQMEIKDQRIGHTNEMLTGIKMVKLYAWEKAFMEKIRATRREEVKQLRRVAYLQGFMQLIWEITPFIMILVTFGIYVSIDPSNVLTPQKTFVAISLFNVIRGPIRWIPQMIFNMIMTGVGLQRVREFLNSEEVETYVTRYESLDAVEIKNANFMWDGDNGNGLPFRLRDINITIPKQRFIAVVGSVGSGKSSFLNAVLGEMQLISGSVNICPGLKMAYVSQQPWIQNESLRNNVLFGQEFDKAKYKEVLKACNLDLDLHSLAAGDRTEIGERGINLSGGQKQRVNLARACYQGADLYIMDDVLSAVDAHVANHLIQNVLSSETGMLKSRTRILVTNNLTVLPQVDEIIVLKKGRIIQRGTYHELMSSEGHFATLISSFKTEETKEDSPDSRRSSEGERELQLLELAAKKLIRQRKRTRTFTIAEGGTDDGKLIDHEQSAIGSVSWETYRRYLVKFSLVLISTSVIGYAGTQAFWVASTFWLSRWSNMDEKAMAAHTNGTIDRSEITNLAVFGVYGVFQAVFACMALLTLAVGGLKASRRLHDEILDTALHSPMRFFDTTPLGRILNRFSKDMDAVDAQVTQNFGNSLNWTFRLLCAVIAIAIEIPIFLIVFAPIGLVCYFIQRLFLSTMRQIKRLEAVSRSPIYSQFSETLTGRSTIKAYNAEERFIQESNDRVDVNTGLNYARNAVARWLFIRLQILGSICVFVAAIFAILRRNSLSSGSVGLIISYSMTVTECLTNLLRVLMEFETNMVSTERLLEYIDNEREPEWYSSTDREKLEKWPAAGEIEFCSYSARYRPELELVLKNVDIQIKPGEKIGIVGRTGCGKSSLTSALFRLIEPAKGTIKIDSLDITQLGLQELRSKITIIPQDPFLFTGSLRRNLDPLSEHTDEEIWRCLDESFLARYVQNLDGGLDFEVNEGGENFSAGQRQLVCLARALLRNTRILILDEATASVDVATDALIQNTIRENFANCTVLTVAHRLNTIMDSDRVLVLNEGKVLEFDTPAALLRDEDSIFHKMYLESKSLEPPQP